MKVGGLPFRKGHGFVLWYLPKHSKRAWVGGAFRAQRSGRWSGSTIVPGSKTISEKHTRRAHRVLVTFAGVEDLRSSFEANQESGWRRKSTPFGRSVMEGRAIPPDSRKSGCPYFP